MNKYLLDLSVKDELKNTTLDIKLNIGSRSPEEDEFIVGFQTILYNLYSMLPGGFYLPPSEIVLAPGSKYRFVVETGIQRESELGDYLVEILYHDPRTGNEFKVHEVYFSTIFSYNGICDVNYKGLEAPYEIIIKIKRVEGQNTFSDFLEFTIHVRNYAVPIFILAYQLLKYVYVPLYVYLMAHYNFSYTELIDFARSNLGELIPLSLEEFPISDEFNQYGSESLRLFETYFEGNNPVFQIFGGGSFSGVVLKIIDGINKNGSLSEETKIEMILSFLLEIGTIYRLFQVSRYISPYYVIYFVEKLINAIIEYYSSINQSFPISGIRTSSLPAILIPNFYSLPTLAVSAGNDIIFNFAKLWRAVGSEISLLDIQEKFRIPTEEASNLIAYKDLQDTSGSEYLTIDLAGILQLGYTVSESNIFDIPKVEVGWEDGQKSYFFLIPILFLKPLTEFCSLISYNEILTFSLNNQSSSGGFDVIGNPEVVSSKLRIIPVISIPEILDEDENGRFKIAFSENYSQFMLYSIRGLWNRIVVFVDLIFKYTYDFSNADINSEIYDFLYAISSLVSEIGTSGFQFQVWITPLRQQYYDFDEYTYNNFCEKLKVKLNRTAPQYHSLFYYRSLPEWLKCLS